MTGLGTNALSSGLLMRLQFDQSTVSQQCSIDPFHVDPVASTYPFTTYPEPANPFLAR
ncbi:MAG: hypothetical protein M9921_13950 [Fimbriimonadaceae bacterium]|nr:hypothetical protein [Fimbriimonadaceae bacterium]